MTREGFDERFVRRKMNCLSWGGQSITLDATYPERIDMDDLIRRIEKLLCEGEIC